jgi:hypothetical protein
MAKATPAASFEALRVGSDPRKDTIVSGVNSGMWVTVQPNEAVNMVVLVEAQDIIACEQCAIWLDEGNSPVWVYTGPEDPSHDLNIDRRYRAYLPVLVEKEGEIGKREQRVFSMGKTVHMALLDIADAVGSIAGVEIRVKRTGTGLATRYSVAQTGKRFDVSKQPEVDVISLLGPITPEGVRDLLCTKLGKGSYEDVIAAYKGKGTSRKHKAKASSGTTTERKVSRTRVEDDEEEDLESVELL